MKIQRENLPRRARRGCGAPKPAPAGERGSAVLIFITLLAIMLILVAANSKALFHLHRDLKLLEQRQIERLNASQTNAVATVEPPVKTEPK